MNTKHTPTPWRYQEEREASFGGIERVNFQVYSSRGPFANPATCDSAANAEFIVRAVNHHEELVAVLKDCKEHLEYCGYGDSWEHEVARSVRLPERLEALLAKLEAKP